jgi:hypothetical protein
MSENSWEGQKRQKKTAGVAGGFWRIGFVLFRYVQNSLPPQALENQK